jgi:hypothetical protein
LLGEGCNHLSEAVITRKAMVIKNVCVKLKRSRLDLITYIDRIKIVLREGVKKGSYSRT